MLEVTPKEITELLDYEDKKLKMGKETEIKRATDDLSSDSAYMYSFNCPAIDIPYGGGIGAGRIYEIFAEESHGKTTFALNVARQFCDYWDSKGDSKYAVLWIESESALDKGRAKFMGVPIERFIIFETDILQHAGDKIKSMLVRCVAKDMKLLIVWDTIAACDTINEKESGTNSGGLMEKPRVIKKILHNITLELGQTQSTLIALNQVSIKMGQFNTSWDSTGGKALKHHASVRTHMKKIAEDNIVAKNGVKQMVGIVSELFHVKNKMTRPKLKSLVYINLEKGVDTLETTLRFMKANDLLKPAVGGWNKFPLPGGYAENGKPRGMIEVKWQNTGQLRKLIKEKYPFVLEYFNYLVTDFWCQQTELLKVKHIKKLWAYEEMFLGARKSELTNEERTVASLMHKDIEAYNSSQDAALDKESAAISAKIASSAKPKTVAKKKKK